MDDGDRGDNIAVIRARGGPLEEGCSIQASDQPNNKARAYTVQ